MANSVEALDEACLIECIDHSPKSESSSKDCHDAVIVRRQLKTGNCDSSWTAAKAYVM